MSFFEFMILIRFVLCLESVEVICLVRFWIFFICNLGYVVEDLLGDMDRGEVMVIMGFFI